MIELMPSTLEQICALPADWHGAGTVSNDVLQAIARLVPQPLAHSAETGTGRTTLLFSQLSLDHIVFTKNDVDDGDSLARVLSSPLLRARSVRFIEGPTQRTLAGYQFGADLDVAMIDGPHAFPFPELDYYHLYPRIRAGGILIVDDLQIPTIASMYRILRADDMWRQIEVIGSTAFFRRTGAATLDPFGDGWWTQGFNRPRRFNMANARSHAPRWAKAIWRRLRGRARSRH